MNICGSVRFSYTEAFIAKYPHLAVDLPPCPSMVPLTGAWRSLCLTRASVDGQEEHRRLQTQVSSVTAENEQLGSHIAELSRSVDLPPVTQPSDLQQRLDALTKVCGAEGRVVAVHRGACLLYLGPIGSPDVLSENIWRPVTMPDSQCLMYNLLTYA